MVFVIITIIIEDGTAEITFKLHLGHGTKAKPNIVFFLYLTGKIDYVLSSVSLSKEYMKLLRSSERLFSLDKIDPF